MTLQLVTFRRSETEVALKSSVKHESRLLLTVTLFIFPSVIKWHYFEMTVEICQTRLSERSKSLFFVLRGTLFIIFKSPIIHLVYPPQNFEIQSSQKESKTMFLQNLGGNKMHYDENGEYKKGKIVWIQCVIFMRERQKTIMAALMYFCTKVNEIPPQKRLIWGGLYCFYLRLVPLKKWLNK